MYKNATFLNILGPYKPNKSVLELWKTYFQRGPYIFQEFFILWPPLMGRSVGSSVSNKFQEFVSGVSSISKMIYVFKVLLNDVSYKYSHVCVYGKLESSLKATKHFCFNYVKVLIYC